jgi:hypothetical protein
MLPSGAGRGCAASGWPAGWRDPENDFDALTIDLDASDDGVNDLAHAVPAEAVEALGRKSPPAD